MERTSNYAYCITDGVWLASFLVWSIDPFDTVDWGIVRELDHDMVVHLVRRIVGIDSLDAVFDLAFPPALIVDIQVVGDDSLMSLDVPEEDSSHLIV